MKIYLYPHSMLSRVSKRVEDFDTNLRDLVQGMIQTMRAYEGVGLSAIQVGEPKMVMIIQHPDDSILVCVNPTVSPHGLQEEMSEGCLSLPRIGQDVIRYKSATVHAQDEYGRSFVAELENRSAQVAQHEIEHLDGDIFIPKKDRAVVSAQMRALVRGKEFNDIRKRYVIPK